MLSYAMLSKPGGRARNEDCVKMAVHGGAWCFALADGLGGHGGGAEASRLAAGHVTEDFSKCGEVSEKYLKKCFESSQRLLLASQQEKFAYGMKTTLVLLLVDADSACWGHIGDSRLYFFKNQKQIKRTLDHSVPQMLALAGKIKEKQIRGHADRSRLLRAMGAAWEGAAGYELSGPVKMEGKEAFLLCSDGFWEGVEDHEMRILLRKSKSPGEWLERMEEKLLKRRTGGMLDNYSAAAVFLDTRGRNHLPA